MTRKYREILVVVAIAILSGGCGANGLFDELSSFDNNDPFDRCRGDAGDLTGLWVFDGEGKRESCEQDYVNTDKFVLHSAAIPIDHDVAAGTLAIGDPDLAGSLRIEAGTVDGMCVDFRTVETVDRQQVSFRWDGEADGSVIRGTFRGTGPGACTSTGTFEMRR